MKLTGGCNVFNVIKDALQICFIKGCILCANVFHSVAEPLKTRCLLLHWNAYSHCICTEGFKFPTSLLCKLGAEPGSTSELDMMSQILPVYTRLRLGSKLSRKKLSTFGRWMWKQSSESSFCTVKLKTSKWGNKTHFWEEEDSNYMLSDFLCYCRKGAWHKGVLAYSAYWNKQQQDNKCRINTELTLLWCNPGRCALTPQWMTARTPEGGGKKVQTDHLVLGN